MLKIKKLIRFLFIPKDKLSLEDRLFLNAIVIALLTSVTGAFINLILSSSIIAVIIPFVLSAMLVVVYYFVRFRNIINPFIFPLVVAAHIGISIIWIFNGGINGSNSFVALVVLILTLIIVPKNKKLFVLFFFLLVNTIIYLIQFYRPELIINFPSERERWVDNYITLIYCSFFIYLIIRFLHRNYSSEREKVEKSEKQLSRLIADKDQLISILAHDLKSPFNGLLGLSDILSKNAGSYSPEKIELLAKRINQSAQSTYSLLEDLLLWTSSQSGKIAFEPQSINLHNICKEIAGELESSAGSKKITIKNGVQEELNLYADRRMIKTILRNLISNAIKFTRAGGQIDIFSIYSGSNHLVSVTDNGIGIPPKKLSKLFDINQVISTPGTSNESGTGLGLLICKEFVEKHNGNIWAESEESQGSTFYFTIPC